MDYSEFYDNPTSPTPPVAKPGEMQSDYGSQADDETRGNWPTPLRNELVASPHEPGKPRHRACAPSSG